MTLLTFLILFVGCCIFSAGFLIGCMWIAAKADRQMRQEFMAAMERDSAEPERQEIIKSVGKTDDWAKGRETFQGIYDRTI